MMLHTSSQFLFKIVCENTLEEVLGGVRVSLLLFVGLSVPIMMMDQW